ncbi:MAG: hypothetical protein EBS77_05300 [Gammaproteobacteria bacterium]|nr:hypothetical protein [Gammaproteobacteria bacterium]
MTALATASVPTQIDAGQNPVARMLATIRLALSLKTVFESTDNREIRLQRTQAILAQRDL